MWNMLQENHGKIGMSMEFPWRWSPVFLVKTVLNPPFTETWPSSFQETPRFMLDPENKEGSLLVENPMEMIKKKHVEHKANYWRCIAWPWQLNTNCFQPWLMRFLWKTRKITGFCGRCFPLFGQKYWDQNHGWTCMTTPMESLWDTPLATFRRVIADGTGRNAVIASASLCEGSTVTHQVDIRIPAW